MKNQKVVYSIASQGDERIQTLEPIIIIMHFIETLSGDKIRMDLDRLLHAYLMNDIIDWKQKISKIESPFSQLQILGPCR